MKVLMDDQKNQEELFMSSHIKWAFYTSEDLKPHPI